MESVTPPNHPTFQTYQRPLFQHGLLQKVVEIASAIKGRIQAITKESQQADHAVIEIRMTCTMAPGVSLYTGR